MSDHLKCKLCGWKTRKWSTRKDGSTSGPEDAFARLRIHWSRKHMEEYSRVEQQESKYCEGREVNG